MIGFDRPVKPEWIYEILKIIKVGDNPTKYNKSFEDIAKELVGKEGKRKARTVIYRSFIYSFQDKRNIIENNMFFEWVKKYNLDFLTPIFLLKLIMDYEVLQYIVEKIQISFDADNKISSKMLTDKMVKQYGDRDIVKRSVRSFLKTLCHFQLLRQDSMQKFDLIKKYNLNEEQILMFIILYSKCYLKSNFVNINVVNDNLTYFFNDIHFHKIAQKYNRIFWEYIRERNKDIIMIYEKNII